MNDRHLAAVTHALANLPNRRHVLRALAGLGLTLGLQILPQDVEAKKNKKRRKGKGRKNKHKKRRKRPTSPPTVPPTTPPPAKVNEVCLDGVCYPCTIVCDGDGAACGAALQAALTAGGTIYACPGRYAGNFAIGPATVELIGAGNGEDPATSTILDANGSGRVVEVKRDAIASLRQLRVTGGDIRNVDESGGGIRNAGRLTLTACAISQNRAKYSAGIHHDSPSELVLNDCVVSDNTATEVFGGVNAYSGTLTIKGGTITGNKAKTGGGVSNTGAIVTIHGCAITRNQADKGGGLYNEGNTTFDSASRVTENSAASGGGIYARPNVNTTLNGASVTGNVNDNCYPAGSIIGCVG